MPKMITTLPPDKAEAAIRIRLPAMGCGALVPWAMVLNIRDLISGPPMGSLGDNDEDEAPA